MNFFLLLLSGKAKGHAAGDLIVSGIQAQGEEVPESSNNGLTPMNPSHKWAMIYRNNTAFGWRCGM